MRERLRGILPSFFASIAGALTFVSAAAADSPQGTVYNVGPTDNWFDRISCDGCDAGELLQPGDTVNLAPGTYSDARRINIFARGTAEHPITIRAADPNNRPIFQRPIELDPYNSRDHVLNVEGAQYLTLDGLEVVGGAWGIRIGSTYRPANPAFFPSGINDRGPLPQDDAKFITLQNLFVRDTGLTGITANMDGDLYEGIIIRNNELTRMGQGDAGIYLGCNNVSGGVTSCVFKDGLIEGNYIYDIDDGNGGGVGDGIQIKDGSYNNIIRDNVIHNTGGSGAVGILVYGTDGNAPNIIEGNVIWNNGDNAIQAASEVIIQNNIIFSATHDAIRSQDHQSAVVGNLTIVNNTIFSIGGRDVIDINKNGNNLSGPIVVANNAIYATQGGRAIRVPSSGDVTVVGNVGIGSDSPSSLSNDPSAWDPTGNLLADFVNYASMNVFPLAGSDLIGAGDASFQPDVDFNGVSRIGSNDVGAYVYDPAGNPGWQIVSAFKEFPGLLGDFDGDEDVDGADFLAWQRGFAGMYDANDLAAWQESFGATGLAAPASASVPEPSSLVLMLSGMLLLRIRPKKT